MGWLAQHKCHVSDLEAFLAWNPMEVRVHGLLSG